MLKKRRSRSTELQARAYEILEQGPVGSRASRDFDRLLILLIVLNLICTALELVPALQQRYALAFNVVEFVSLVVFTIEYAGRHMDRRPASAVPASLAADGALALCDQRCRHHRSALGAAVLAGVHRAGRLALHPGLPLRAVPEADALFARDAFVARRALSRAPCVVRLRGHSDRNSDVRCHADVSGRTPRPARQARHHSGCNVVGDRHPRHDRLWRCRSGDGGRQGDRQRDDLSRLDHDRVAGRHHRQRLCGRSSPSRFRRHLGDGGPRAFVFGLDATEIADVMRLLRAQQSNPAASSCGAATRRIRCISSPPERSRSNYATSGFGSTSGISSARSRSCAMLGAPPT